MKSIQKLKIRIQEHEVLIHIILIALFVSGTFFVVNKGYQGFTLLTGGVGYQEQCHYTYGECDPGFECKQQGNIWLCLCPVDGEVYRPTEGVCCGLCQYGYDDTTPDSCDCVAPIFLCSEADTRGLNLGNPNDGAVCFRQPETFLQPYACEMNNFALSYCCSNEFDGRIVCPSAATCVKPLEIINYP